MYTVYVLRDEAGKIYKGCTNNLNRRLREHRAGKTQTTSRMARFDVVYTESFETFIEARTREVYFKSAAGRKFLKTVIKGT
ncbi:MAG: GIY-YIG nuclease family protein [Candidatus Yanofskybacteria bacterium]|nr:GIY-YIG nuclease family protein [Candidatus Yanofskybacteria bacterium]